MTSHILRVDGSARVEGSISRDLTDKIVARMGAETVTTRDLAQGVPLIDEAWIGANFTPADDRSPEQLEKLATSEAMVAEVKAADTIVIGVPIYNFSVPAAVKAWIDQIARAGLTFKYTETGPKGLLEGKRAIVVIASGGVKSGSEVDYATNYMRHVLGFIGITDIEIVAADQMMVDADASMASANAAIDAIAA